MFYLEYNEIKIHDVNFKHTSIHEAHYLFTLILIK